MASTANSQPLHNFSLPVWKRATNNANNRHYSRRCPKLKNVYTPCKNDSESVNRKNYAAEMTSGHLIENYNSRLSDLVQKPLMLGSELNYVPPKDDPSLEDRKKEPLRDVVRNEVDCLISESESKLPATAGAKEGKSKLLIRFRTAKESPSNKKSSEEGKGDIGFSKLEEVVTKRWNLRPRRDVCKQSNVVEGISKSGALLTTQLHTNPGQLNNNPEAENAARKKEVKQKIFLSLSRQEIEEDIFHMTGTKPVKRPKKRAKHVQKELDNLFPGMWLGSITPSSYRVYAPSHKN